MANPLTIWTNTNYVFQSLKQLPQELAQHRLLLSPLQMEEDRSVPKPDPKVAEADIAYGQPDPKIVIENPRIKWIELSSAGYTRYETQAFLDAMKARGGIMTTSSGVYDEPVAQHALCMMLALSRQLPAALQNQWGPREWPTPELRERQYLLKGQVVSIYGFGSIARQLVAMLAPFKMTIRAARRNPQPFPGVTVMPPADLDAFLGDADHIINVMPLNSDTENYFNADRFNKMKPSAIYYSLGRGTTTDQTSLRTALETNRIAGAFLDVANPEPLPPADLLWRTPNCYIMPHTGGGHVDEFLRRVHHFNDNLRRYLKGEPLRDRVV